LKTVFRTQGNNQALKDGTVKPQTFDFEFEEVEPLIAAFRRMVRAREYDMCELALTTYICSRDYRKGFTALPIFLVRAFHHGAIMCNSKAGIEAPKDLEGRRVGVNRGYTVTTGVWARAILQHQYGVDLNKITWVVSGDDHVAEYVPPSNVVPIEKGKKLEDMVVSGELAAAIGVEVDHHDVKPLIPNAKEAGFEALRRSGHYPINHTVVVKDEVLSAYPDLAVDIFNTFARAKDIYVQRLKSGGIEKATKIDELHHRVMEITGGDPLPYGIAANRQALEEIVQAALEQKIITHSVSIEELFPLSTRDLSA
jgi:4,5-dihydroxyphthalate decarboxylase